MMRTRSAIVLVAALLALVISLPVRVLGASAAHVALPPSKLTTTGPLPAMRITYLPAAAVRAGEPGSIRVVEYGRAHAVADLIFVHGHADRADNHRDLFRAWGAAGLHVISFDLPSHGETSTRRIDAWDDADLFAVIAALARSAGDPDRPLVLAGWSFGGLLVASLLRDADAMKSLGRTPSAAVLLVPAVTPLPFSGGDGISRTHALTHDPAPPVAGPPHPVSPLLDPVFAVRLLVDAWRARAHEIPGTVPVEVVVSDPKQDRFVDAAALLRWAQSQRAGGARVDFLSCTGARHAVDLEPWPIGPEVMSSTVDCLSHQVPGVAAAVPPSRSIGAPPCRPR